MFRLAIVLGSLMPPLIGNTPGGGPESGTPDVTLADTSTPGIYYSMHGMESYRVPSTCTYSVTVNTPNMIDICLHESGAGNVPPFDLVFHYVLRRGDTGTHTYSTVSPPSTYPAGSFNIWRLVWKRPIKTFERLYVDDLRNREMPNSSDHANASPTPIAEILKINTGALSGARVVQRRPHQTRSVLRPLRDQRILRITPPYSAFFLSSSPSPKRIG